LCGLGRSGNKRGQGHDRQRDDNGRQDRMRGCIGLGLSKYLISRFVQFRLCRDQGIWSDRHNRFVERAASDERRLWSSRNRNG
jgi:hypothetical protein